MTKALIIGGHGPVARMATAQLVEAGVEVTSLIRTPAHEADIRELGAEVIVQDLTDGEEWPAILVGFDVVAWAADHGEEAGATQICALDRGGELAVISGLQAMERPPYYLTVSHLGWDRPVPEDDDSSWTAYAKAKQAVGKRLASSHLDYTIFAPARLTDGPAGAYEHVENSREAAEATTSRELLAQVLAEFVQAPAQSGTYAFIDA